MFQLIRRNVGSKMLGEIASRAFFLIFFFYVGRKMGTAEFGTLNLAISTTYILGVLLLDPGLCISTIQLLVSRKADADQIASAVFSLKLLMFFPMVAVLWAVCLALRVQSFYVFFLAALYALFTAILEYFCSLTNAFHRMDVEAFLKISNRILVVVFGVVALRIGHLPALLWSMWTATSVGCALAWFLLRRSLVSVRFQWNYRVAKEALLAGIPIAGTAIATTVYLKWDLLVLSYFNIGRQEIGWYAGAFKIVEAFAALPTILGAALFPIIVQLRVENPGYLDRLLRMSTKGVLLVSIPVAAAICLFSKQIIVLVYGAKYLPAANVLAVLIWCIVPIFLYFYLMFVNIAAGHARHNLLAGCIALGAGLVANALLVPKIGFLGAAWAALIANSSFALLATWKVCSLFRNARIPPVLLKLFLTGALMMAAALFTPGPVMLQVGLGFLVYVAGLVISGLLGAEDISLALRMFQGCAEPQAQGL